MSVGGLLGWQQSVLIDVGREAFDNETTFDEFGNERQVGDGPVGAGDDWIQRGLFGRTVSNTVRPMLRDRCLSCLSCLSVLSVTLVYGGQTVGWIKARLGVQVDLCPGHIVLDWNPAPLPQRGTLQFSAYIRCSQMAGWIKMPLGMEVGLGPGDFVLWDLAPSPQKGAEPPKIFGHVYCGQTAGWITTVLGMEVGLRPGDPVVDGDPAPLPKKGRSPQIFGPCLSSPNGWMGQDGTWHGGGPWSRPHCARWRPSSPPPKMGRSP